MISITLVSILLVSTSLQSDEVNSPNSKYPESPTKVLVSSIIKFYRNVLSPSVVSDCSMQPTCSAYAEQVLRKYNSIEALLAIIDRLNRCGHDIGNYPHVFIEHRWKNLDFPSEAVSENSTISVNGNDVELPEGVRSDNTGTDEAGRLYKFANYLNETLDWDRAITEYKRQISYFPDSKYRELSVYGLAQAYYHKGDYPVSIFYSDKLLENDKWNQAQSSYLLKTKAYLQAGELGLAEEYLKKLDHSVDENLQYLLESIRLAKAKQWSEAIHTTLRVENNSIYFQRAESIRETCFDMDNYTEKKPWLAGVLSVIPGLGYVYDGYLETGVATFLINGLLAWGAYEAFSEDQDGLGWGFAILGTGWYAGNIYGAVNTASDQNARMKEKAMMRISGLFDF